MSEQNQCNNWPQKLSPEVPEEMLRMSIPVIAPALVWIGVIGNLQVALAHPQNVRPSRGMVQDFARQFYVVLWSVRSGNQERNPGRLLGCGPNDVVGYYLGTDPKPIKMVQPTDNANNYGKKRITPMIEACPALHSKIKAPTSRRTRNTLKGFPGGFLKLTGANSGAGHRSDPVPNRGALPSPSLGYGFDSHRPLHKPR